MLKDLAIEHLKSGLSINTHIGCSLGCKYCVLESVKGFPKTPMFVKSASDIVDSIYNKGAAYIINLTPIYVNNRTDPFLPTVIESTYSVLSELEKRNCLSPIILITKLYPDARISYFCNRLNLLFFYTFSNLPGWDFNSNLSVAKNSLERIVEFVPRKNLFHYFRPIIPGLNDGYDDFVFAIKEVGKYFRATCIGGIRINQINRNAIGIFEYDKNHKFFQDDYYYKILSYISDTGIMVFRHTSCAISFFMGKKNHLGYFNDKKNCYGRQCENFAICSSSSQDVDIELIEILIHRITNSKFVMSDREIKFEEPVSQEIIACHCCPLKNRYSSLK